MSKIDITCSDYIQQPYVIASLFQSALLDDNDVIMESDVVLQDTREPKIMNNGEKHQERVVMYMPESRCMIPIIPFHVISVWN